MDSRYALCGGEDDDRRQPNCKLQVGEIFGDTVSHRRATYASKMMPSVKSKEDPGPTLINSTGTSPDLPAVHWFVECDWYSSVVSVSSRPNSLLDSTFEMRRRYQMYKNPTTTIP